MTNKPMANIVVLVFIIIMVSPQTSLWDLIHKNMIRYCRQ